MWRRGVNVREEWGGGGVRAEVVRAAVRGAPRDVVNLRFTVNSNRRRLGVSKNNQPEW